MEGVGGSQFAGQRQSFRVEVDGHDMAGADEPRRSKAVAAAEQARRLAALVRAAVKQDMPSHEKAP